MQSCSFGSIDKRLGEKHSMDKSKLRQEEIRAAKAKARKLLNHSAGRALSAERNTNG
jgi:hypothetical protein